MSAVTGDEYQQSIWLLRATTPFFRKRHKAPSLMDEPTRFVRMEEAPGSSGCDTESGGNLAECIVFGKIAGEEAATAKDDAVALPEGLTHGPGSGDVSVYDEAPDESGLSSGEAVGVGEGLGGPLWVKVAATGGAIDAVEVLRHTEHAEVGAPALDELRARMVQAGTPDVDAVAGATVTSMGLKEAVRNALGHGA